MEQRYSGSATLTLTTEPGADPNLITKWYENARGPFDGIDVESVTPHGATATVEVTPYLYGYDNTIYNQWVSVLSWLETEPPTQASWVEVTNETAPEAD